MKNRIYSQAVVLVGFVSMTLFALPVVAQTSSPAPTLTSGSANVLKLAQAKVGDEIILAYVEKSDLSYGMLGASEIIYLREQGVSDRVLKTMLGQEKKTRDIELTQSLIQQTPAAPVQVAQPAPTVVVAPQQTYVPPAVTYVQAAPAPLIVMRDSSPRLTDYGIYPPRYGYGYGYYPSYGYRSYGYYNRPNISFSVGFGGHGHYGGFGYHGGHH